MNLLAHIRVARAISDDPAVWLGAALPDLQKEVGVPIGSLQDWGEPVRVGVTNHHAVDATFHDLPVFLAGSRALTRDLLERGVPRGAARAVGHAGWELLLDGLLVADGALTTDYLAAMSVEVDNAAWRAALARRVARGVPTLYAEPAQVTDLLGRILASRPRLAFGSEHATAVTTALRTAQPGVAAGAAAVFSAVMPAAG